MTRLRICIALVAILTLAFTGLPSAAFATAAPATGSLVIRLVKANGAHLALASAVVSVVHGSSPWNVGTTGADGTVLFTNLAPTDYFVDVRILPAGPSTYTGGTDYEHVTVVAGATVYSSFKSVHGASVTGRLIGPDGKALAGATVTGSSYGIELTSVTTADGLYSFVGLPTADLYLSSSLGSDDSALNWQTWTRAESGGTPPSHTVLSTRMVHSSYNVRFTVLSTLEFDRDLAGATVSLVDASGRRYEQHTNGYADMWQKVQFLVPSGRYVVQVRTVAASGLPTTTYWLDQLNNFVPDATKAAPVTLSYSAPSSVYGTIVSR
jgi:hypothetical protein